MEYGVVIGFLHQGVALLLYPVVIALLIAVAMCLMEVGLALVEGTYSLRKLINSDAEAAITKFEHYAAVRLERVDLLSRAGPTLGLMGTLIPLGPGLTALGNGQLDMLATALSVAFDTTVVGLFVGLIAFIVAKLRRRWYDNTWRLLNVNLVGGADGE